MVNEVLGALEAMTSHAEIARNVCEAVRDMLEASSVGKEDSAPEDEEDSTEVEEEEEDDDDDDDEDEVKRKEEEREGEPKYPPMDR